MLCWLCCAAGECESSRVACAHEHTAIGFASGYKLDICHFQQGVKGGTLFYLNPDQNAE